MTHPFRILDAAGGSAKFSGEFEGKCALAVMSKVPRPGKVKTRLSPPLTPAQAATLNTRFLLDTIENLRAVASSAPAVCVISYTPAGEESAFVGIVPESTMLLPQRGDVFGERLLRTAEDLFSCGFAAVCLIDSDSPTVPAAAYARAVAELGKDGDRAVLGPSEDGGYYLIGLKHAHAQLFERIAWSTEVVAQQTLERAAETGLSVTLLERWYDVDDSNTLSQLQDELFAEEHSRRGYPAPHTRAYMREFARYSHPAILAGAELP